MIVVACDPGTNGALAVVCSVRGLLDTARMPIINMAAPKAKCALNFVDSKGLLAQLRHWRNVHNFAADDVCSVIEWTAAFPGARAYAAHQMGAAFQGAEMALTAIVSPPKWVKPSVWKKRFGLSSDKSESVAAVRRIYGDQVPKVFGHDKAEAVLLARWWMLENN